MFIKVLGVEIALSGEDPFGQISGGTIRLQCTHLLESPVVIDASEHFRKIRFGQKKITWQLYWDATPEREMKVCFLPILEESGIHGIFLESIEGNGQGHFRRLGFFKVSDLHADRFYEAVAMPESVPDKSKYEEKAGVDKGKNDLYVISIT